MKKSLHKNYYRNNNQLNKNYDKDFQNMKDSFEMVSSLYNEIQNNLISPNIQISKLKQNYKCLLDEFNKLKDYIEKILEKKS
jgi:phage shock protein A